MSAWEPMPDVRPLDGESMYRRDYGSNLWGTYMLELVCALDVVDDTGKGVLSLLEEDSPESHEGCRAMIDEAAAAYVVCAALAAILRLLPA